MKEIKQSKLNTFIHFWETQNKKCYYCKLDLWDGKTLIPCNFDHKNPRSKGGHDNIENLCISCVDCNSLKGSMTEEEFLVVVAEAKLKKIDRADYADFAKYVLLKKKFDN